MIFETRKSKDWDSRVPHAELMARSPGFRDLRDRILAFAEPNAGESVVDVGAGTGLLTLAVAPRVEHVWAIDFSPAMCEYLGVKASSAGLENVDVVVASAASLPLVDNVADLVISNYCLHELGHEDKMLALGEAMRVLRPGGRLVFGDMMFSLNPMAARDRTVVTDKVRSLASRGLPGIWRIIKNGLRLISGRWEAPANVEWWQQALRTAGFERVSIQTLSHEGGIAVAYAPGNPSSRAPASDGASEPALARTAGE
jgi:ubiquinone/menaquinone biosynthesis C-methylase UbiE